MIIALIRHILLLCATCALFPSYHLSAQHNSIIIRDRRVRFDHKEIDVPQLHATTGEQSAVANSLNQKIIERFNLIPDAPENEEDYDAFVSSLHFFEDFAGYLDIDYSYEMRRGVVEIKMEGNFVEFEGKPSFEIYQVYKEETFYVDIGKGKLFDVSGYESELRLRYFFESKDYIDLLSRTWVPKIEEVRKKYPDDVDYEYACEDCSSVNVHLYPLDFEYELKDDGVHFFLNSVAYYRDFCFRSFCSPQLSISVSTKELKPYFKEDFDLFKYSQLDPLSKVLFYKENLENELQETRIIAGRVDGQYPFLMCYNLHDLTGYYMYTSKREFLTLKGKVIRDGHLEIVEYLNDEVTGRFELKFKEALSSEYDIEEMKWHSPDGRRSFDVKVDDLEIY